MPPRRSALLHSLPTAAPDKLREYCGVIAVYRPAGNAPRFVHRGLFALQHRGQEAAGLTTLTERGDLRSLRGHGLVSAALPVEQVAELGGRMAIGHVRYSTVPVDHEDNIQPFTGATPFGPLSIAHNGNFKNAEALTAALLARGTTLSTTMDTELLLHLIAQAGRAGAADFSAALREAVQSVVGAYSLALLCGGRLYGLRDAHGFRPLVIGRLPGKEPGWVLASETCALRAVGASYLREVAPGELVELGPQGILSTPLLPPSAEPAPCVFELIYFSRPDSEVFGQSTQAARVRMGAALAAQDADLVKPDLVIPIPDSGVPAAVGYARESRVPVELAILRSHYVGRTFILPNHDARTHAVSLKHAVVASAVAGKRVVLVDDSLVRGNTARLLVQMVRESGAREVWLRLASPPIAMPCYLGIDTPTKDELLINQVLAHGRAREDEDADPLELLRRSLGADSLRYLSLEELRRATLDRSFCMACMDGRYPV